MVNANLFSIKHPFNWHRRRFIAVSPIKKRILECMYICTYVCTYVHTMSVFLIMSASPPPSEMHMNAAVTSYVICVVSNFDSSEQYFSAKCAIC